MRRDAGKANSFCILLQHLPDDLLVQAFARNSVGPVLGGSVDHSGCVAFFASAAFNCSKARAIVRPNAHGFNQRTLGGKVDRIRPSELQFVASLAWGQHLRYD
jgi:hypothetical protein